MFIKSISSLAGMSVAIVAFMYPKEFNDPWYAREIFELVELVGDDLIKRNASLFVDQYINELANVKDIAFGDTADFIVS